MSSMAFSAANSGPDLSRPSGAGVDCLNMYRLSSWQVVVVVFVLVLGVGVSTGLAILIVRVNDDARHVQISNEFHSIVQVFDDVWGELFAGSELLATYIQHAFYDNPNGPSRDAFRQLSRVLLDVLPVATFRYAFAFNESDKMQYVRESSEFYRAWFNTPNKTYWISAMKPNNVRQRNYTSEDGRYVVISFVEPLEGNKGSINVDIKGKPGRLEWMESLRRKGQGELTEPFDVFNEGSIATSIFQPVRGRQDFILTLIRFKDVLRFAAPDPPPGSEILLFDSTSAGKSVLLASTGTEPLLDGQTFLPPSQHATVAAAGSRYRNVTRTIGNRYFELYLVASEELFPYSSLTAVLVGCLGSATTFVFCAVLVLKFGRQRMIIEAQMLNAKWQERARVERAASNFIAHEVRNPLSVAITALKHVREDKEREREREGAGYSERLSDKHNTDIELVEASLSYIDDLLRNVLDLNKIHREHTIDLQLSVFSLRSEVLCKVQKMLDVGSAEVQLKVDCAEPLWVETDRLRVKQVVMNLAKNAYKFTQAGFISLSAYRKSENVVVLSVADSGPGIPAEKRQALFQPYASINNIQSQGTGIGLSICKLLVEAMKGTIHLDETYDSKIPGSPGAKFIVELPLRDMKDSLEVHPVGSSVVDGNGFDIAERTASEPKNRTLSDKSSGKNTPEVGQSGYENVALFGNASTPEKRRLLVVDDEPLVRIITKRHLERSMPEGWVFEECSNGEEAVEACKENRFDVLLIDHYMNHELTGEKTIRKLRQAGCNAVIIGYSANDVSQLHLAAGANEFWGKPLPAKAKLLNDIQRLLVEKDNRQNAADSAVV